MFRTHEEVHLVHSAVVVMGLAQDLRFRGVLGTPIASVPAREAS